MSALRANFQQTNAFSISTALHVLQAELNAVEFSLLATNNEVQKQALLMRKRQLQNLILDMNLQKQQGFETVKQSTNKASVIVVALIIAYLARENAKKAELRKVELKRELENRHLAPRLAA